VLRPGGGAGRPARREAAVVRPRVGGGPVGRGAGRLRRGGARRGAGGDRPGEGPEHQEEHAGPTAPQRRRFLPGSGEQLTAGHVCRAQDSLWLFRPTSRCTSTTQLMNERSKDTGMSDCLLMRNTRRWKHE